MLRPSERTWARDTNTSPASSRRSYGVVSSTSFTPLYHQSSATWSTTTSETSPCSAWSSMTWHCAKGLHTSCFQLSVAPIDRQRRDRINVAPWSISCMRDTCRCFHWWELPFWVQHQYVGMNVAIEAAKASGAKAYCRLASVIIGATRRSVFIADFTSLPIHRKTKTSLFLCSHVKSAYVGGISIQDLSSPKTSHVPPTVVKYDVLKAQPDQKVHVMRNSQHGIARQVRLIHPKPAPNVLLPSKAPRETSRLSVHKHQENTLPE
jgi:hypothetical protein